MNEVKRLFGYVRYYKASAVAAVLLAVVVSMLSFAQLPVIVPLFNAIFSDDQGDIAEWPDKIADATGIESLREPMRSFLEQNVIPTGPGDRERRFHTLVWAVGILMALSILKGVRAVLPGVHGRPGLHRRLAAPRGRPLQPRARPFDVVLPPRRQPQHGRALY